MTRENPIVDLVNINVYKDLFKFCQFFFKILKNKLLASITGRNFFTNLRKMMCNNPKVDLVNVYTNFDQILSIFLKILTKIAHRAKIAHLRASKALNYFE